LIYDQIIKNYRHQTMKNIITLVISFLFLSTATFAQYKGVTFDYEKVVFGENQPLPAEAHIMLQGVVKPEINLVELEVLEPKGKESRRPLYSNKWKRTKGSVKNIFLLPINFKLRGSSEYDINIKYYTPIPQAERDTLTNILNNYLFTYLEQVIIVNRNTLSLQQNERQIIRSLNKIVHKGLSMYRNRTDTDFEGFSDLIKFKLKQISTASLSKGKALFQGEETADAKVAYREKLLSGLRSMIRSELKQYMNLEWSKMIDNKYIDNYSTKKANVPLPFKLVLVGLI